MTGVLVSLRRSGMPGFDDDMADLVTSFADHAALGLSLAEARVRERQFHVLAIAIASHETSTTTGSSASSRLGYPCMRPRDCRTVQRYAGV